jgi:2-keto-3-deoxy-6-phosphogluconate aldolase
MRQYLLPIVIREGGIPILEITMTVPGAISAIAELSKRYGDEVLVGAGTVLDPETARSCIAAGAQFIVSPALTCANHRIVQVAKDRNLSRCPNTD